MSGGREKPKIGKWMVVARKIAAEMTEGRIRPGEVLHVEAESTAHYGVSRSTLREALRVLQYLGLVEIRMGRTGGIVLREPTPENLAQILTLYLQFTGCTWRQLLEAYTRIKPLIVDSAARNRSSREASDLEAMLGRFDTCGVEDQVRMMPSIVKTYHGMSGNPMLSLLGRAFETVVLSHTAQAARPSMDAPAQLAISRQLAQEIVNGDSAKAVEAVNKQTEIAIALMERDQPELIDSVIAWE